MGKFIKECFLQKTNQFDALDFWEEIKIIGTHFSLSFDQKEENVVARLISDNSKIIGVLSKEDSKQLEPFLKGGWNKYENGTVNNVLFVGVVSKVDEKADENKKISICIFVKDASEYAG